MVRSKAAGFTLTEVVMALAISAILVLGISGLLQSTFVSLLSGEGDLKDAQARMVLKKALLRRLSMSNLVTYGLSGSTVPTDTHGRNLFALPSVCADQTSGAQCASSTLVHFASVEHGNNVPVTAYCWNQVAQTLIVDRTIEDLLNAPGETRDLIALIQPPAMTTWGISEVSATTPNPLPADCIARVPKLSNGQPDLAALRQLRLFPLSIKGGNPVVSANLQAQFNQKFPQRVSRINMYAAGLLPSVTKAGVMDFVLNACKFSPTSGMSCADGQTLAKVENIKANYYSQRFKVRVPSAPDTIDYQIVGASVGLAKTCEAPTCAPMTLRDWTTTPYRLPGETRENLIPTEFSLMKQDLIESISLTLVDGKDKYQTIQLSLE